MERKTRSRWLAAGRARGVFDLDFDEGWFGGTVSAGWAQAARRRLRVRRRRYADYGGYGRKHLTVFFAFGDVENAKAWRMSIESESGAGSLVLRRGFHIKGDGTRVVGGSVLGIVQAGVQGVGIAEFAADVHGEFEFPAERLDDVGGGDLAPHPHH
jgi:hypothetical protein